MITIVLPTYNGIQYIKSSVASILSQTYTNIELIIVDDCSTDGTSDIVDELAQNDERIQVIHNETNKKLPCSLNIGFENARGDYFTWTSDDNLYKRNALEVMLTCLKKNPKTDIVYAMYETIDCEGKLVIENANWEKISAIQNWVGACFLYKRKVHEKLQGYDENLFLVEDFDFWLRATRYFNFKKISQNLYQYRIHANSLTNKRSSEIIAKTIKLLQREIEQGYVQPQNIAQYYKHFTNYYYSQSDEKMFRKYLKLLRETGDKTVKINLSYRLAEVIGIDIIKKLWKYRYYLKKMK